MLIANPTKAQAIWNTHIHTLTHFHFPPEIPKASKDLIVVTLPPKKDSTLSVLVTV